MLINIARSLIITLALLNVAGCASSPPNDIAVANAAVPPAMPTKSPVNGEVTRLVISIHDQRMTLIKGSVTVANYVISTATNGVGEAIDSGRTPRGRHAIAEKIGAGVPTGTVFVDRVATKEIVAVNALDNSSIVTRIFWLRGLEDKNQTTFKRFIYLQGTPAENLLGKPASGGNIRMRSVEIVDLFERVDVGTEVAIFEEPMEAALALLADSDAKFVALENAAKSGSVSAFGQLCYGQLYGANGIPMNEVSALGWCSRAADKNDPNAITLMGEIYEYGKGTAIDLALARQFYERAAKLGHPYAQYATAVLYKAGKGGPTNETLAVQYLELSAQQGSPEAVKLLKFSAPQAQ